MSTKVVTGKVRVSYANLFEPRAAQEGQEPKYSATLLIPKSDKETLKKLRAAEQEALEAGKDSKFGGKIPKAWSSIIRDADSDEEEEMLEKNPEYAGHYFMAVKNKRKPGIVDKNLNPILDATEVYSGCYIRASINAFSYSIQGNKGVSFGLNNVQKLADGEPFGGITRAEDDFSEFEDDEDDLI